MIRAPRSRGGKLALATRAKQRTSSMFSVSDTSVERLPSILVGQDSKVRLSNLFRRN